MSHPCNQHPRLTDGLASGSTRMRLVTSTNVTDNTPPADAFAYARLASTLRADVADRQFASFADALAPSRSAHDIGATVARWRERETAPPAIVRFPPSRREKAERTKRRIIDALDALFDITCTAVVFGIMAWVIVPAIGRLVTGVPS